MKKLLPIAILLILAIVAIKFAIPKERANFVVEESHTKIEKTKKTPEQRALYAEERDRYEYELQANPATGLIPLAEKELEFKNSKKALVRFDGGDNLRAPVASIINRGPTNLGGRTRTIVPHRTNSNIIIAGGVSSGVFKTTNGGTSWTKVSQNDEIHNVTAIVQDPRAGFEDTWYYATGELRGNSASNSGTGSDTFGTNGYYGSGIWKSTDGGDTWSQFSTAGADQTSFDSTFDYVSNLAIDPLTGYLYAAVLGQVLIYLPSPPVVTAGWYNVQGVASCCSNNQYTDVAITSTGEVYFSIGGGGANAGVYRTTSAAYLASKAPIKVSTFTPSDRIVLGLAPSNTNKVYALYDNGASSSCSGVAAPEADLQMWTLTGTTPVAGTWTNYSSLMPDETGCSDGNDPFNVQGGYNLSISVKPNNEDFVVIGGTNAYRISDITSGSFTRIGGYANALGYSQYANHHPDVHALVFNPHNNDELFSGTDGGIHKTSNINAGTVAWTSLNNDYQTQQFYHVTIDPQSGSDYVLGGLQDNGTNVGGTNGSQVGAGTTTQVNVFSGDGVAVGIAGVAGKEFVGTQYGNIVRRNKGSGYQFGSNITPSSGSSSQFVTYFYLDPDNNNNLYYAGNSSLLRTTNSTTVSSGTWTTVGTPSGLVIISRMAATWGAYNASTSYLLMGGANGVVHRLDDPQNAASIATSVNITPAGATGTVTGLAVHPNDRKIVMLTYSNYGITNIYVTQDVTVASPVWEVAERNLSSHSIRSAAITTNSAGEALYVVGTARGLYSSTNPVDGGSGVDWTREAPNDIGFAVVSSLAYRPADNKLLIGTHGNGMFEATINHVLGLEDNEISESIKLYPNPVKNRLNLNMPSEISDNASFIIHNVLGQNVMNGSLENNSINVNNLDTGLYFLEINSNGKKGVKRFIKQ